MKKPPLIPLRNGAIVVPDGRKIFNDYASVPPSYMMYPYECVRLNIPDLVVADDGVQLEVAFKPVKALRIYCRHDITEERHNSGDINGGVGTEDDPFQNFWKAVDFANCLSMRMCQWVQLIIDSEKPITIFGNTSEIIALDGEFLVIGDLDNSIRFTSLVPLYSRIDDLNRSPIIASANLKYKKDYWSPAFPYGGYRKLIKVNAEGHNIRCQQYVECDIKADLYVTGASGRHDGDYFTGKSYLTSISAQSVHISYMTKVTFISTESEGFFNSSSRFVYDCKITGPNYWEKGYGGAEFSVDGAIHDCTIDRYQIMASGADIHNLTANHAYIWACGENTVIDGLTVNFEVLCTEENKSSFLKHAGNIGGVIKNATITQNIRIGAMYWGWENYSHWFKYGSFRYDYVNICDDSIVNDVTINSKLTLLKSINIPEEFIDGTSVSEDIYAVRLGANGVVVRNLNASMSFNIEVELKNYCFYINDIFVNDKCQGNWRVVRNGKIDVDAGECEPKCQDK